MNFDELLKAAKKLKENIKSPPANNFEVTGESGAGMVKITINSKYHITALNIEDEVISFGKVAIQDLIKSAFNSALDKLQKQLQEQTLNAFGDHFK